MNLFELHYKDRWEFKNIDLNLNSIDNALKEINFSQKSLGKIIHIAGTNGKGSTSFFMAQMLKNVGVNVALFTSPHILDITERLNFNLENISTKEFDTYFSKYKHIIEQYNLSYFESVFLISIVWFIDNKPDVTILETGLGGTFDATNTSMITDKICIITSISQDHTDFLGKNIYGIIDDKLGIKRENSSIFLGVNKNFINEYIKSKITKNLIEVVLSQFEIDNYPYPYSENYCLAKSVTEYIIGKSISDTKGLKLPSCRLEKIDNLIFDGSHNVTGLLSLKKSNYIPENTTIIFSATKERDVYKTYNILSQISNDIIVTTIPNNNRSISHENIQNIDCNFIVNYIDAFNLAIKRSKTILITGSFYLCSAIKKYYLGAENV